MKNVFKRGLNLLTLFSSNNENITTDFIKDNILDYRELGDSAFKRSFERDKSLLKEMGYLIEFENDKWKLSDGYSISGTRIIEEIKKTKNIDTNRFISIYQIIKKYLNLNYQLFLLRHTLLLPIFALLGVLRLRKGKKQYFFRC